jgi:hypothetical protein
MEKASIPDLLLRVGLAFAFLYPPLNALFDPYSWLGYFPQFLLTFGHSIGLSDLVMLHGFGVVEVVIALWVLSGWRIMAPALLACAMLLAIVIFNWPQFPVLFRDLSIAATALALAVSAKQI